MQRSRLLIVDGEILRTPGLVKVLEREGWEQDWANGASASHSLPGGAAPDLVLFDPGAISAQGLAAIVSLRLRKPGLPTVALGATEPFEAALREAGLEPSVLRHLDSALPMEDWPGALRACLGAFGPGSGKFTAEDLFGDILAEIMDKPAELPRQGTSLFTPAELPRQGTSLFTPAELLALGGGSPARPHGSVAPGSPAAAPVSPGLTPTSSAQPPVLPALPPVLPAQPPVLPALPPGLPAQTPASSAQLPASSAQTPVLPALPPASFAQTPVLPAQSLASVAQPPGWSTRATLPPELLPAAPAPALPPELSPAAPAPALPPELLPAAPAPALPAAVSEPPADYSLEEFGNYYLLEKIAVGGMAELFKARQRGVHNFEKIVAIKRILPHLSDNDEFVRMFIDEAKLAAQLTHPNIVQIFDLGKAGGFYYIAMEFVDGRDLRSLLRKVREYKLPLPEAVAALVTLKVASALDYAHRERGINDRELKLVHRDISPQNIILSYDGAVKLVDFGIAKAATKSTQTMAGALKGKLLYMSPEQALGQHLDGRSDIYSLGLVLFELLTGERCFQADSELGVLEKVRLGKVQDARTVNPDLSPEMVAILDKALQRDVDRRYGTARLLERDLKALLVKHANEPTEHDVAEYVQTLLRGTRAELVTLLATRFAAPVSGPAPAGEDDHASAAVPAASLASAPEANLAADVEEPALALTPEPARERGHGPAWLMPAALGLVLVLLLGVWLLLRH